MDWFTMPRKLLQVRLVPPRPVWFPAAEHVRTPSDL